MSAARPRPPTPGARDERQAKLMLHRNIGIKPDLRQSAVGSRAKPDLDSPASPPFSANRPPSSVLRPPIGGARRDRTDDLMLAKHALSQLSYGPGTVTSEQ